VLVNRQPAATAWRNDRHPRENQVTRHKSGDTAGVERVLLTPMSNRRVTEACKFIHAHLAVSCRLMD
jgi:hypothetical protein